MPIGHEFSGDVPVAEHRMVPEKKDFRYSLLMG
jgi:hypothetical protein